MVIAMAAKGQMPFADFDYRQNIDGTMDSICLRCFMTAATGITKEDLSKKELEHANYCFGKKCLSVQFTGEDNPKRK